MGLVFRLDEYPRYLGRVGDASVLDLTRRTDPACIDRVWVHLQAIVDSYGPPWILQLWTKNAARVLQRARSKLVPLVRQGTTLVAQVTVTGLNGTPWEPLVPEPFAGVQELIELLGGPEHIKWRYDPVIPTVHRLDRFGRLAAQAAALGITRCVVNFLVPPGRYTRVDARLSAFLPGWSEGMPGYDGPWRAEAARQLVETATGLGLTVATCAEAASLAGQVPGLGRAACGDHDWFVALSGRDPGRATSQGSRPGCGCAAYFDVGLYGQWRRCHRCLYCYAS
jgi:hypothetical protein